ncbi:hypothetical protein [uncultured Roseobacter sp.]|uniref:hypothetical protein n=1 Tax=uncultured Roseobacter sp. TaxID=114847 RepID=UPI00260C965C|nr:hypothetical protein [uncultured Roseobacter sp.]
MAFPGIVSIPIKAAGTVASLAVLAPIVLPEHVPLAALSGACGGLTRWAADRNHIWPHGAAAIVSGIMVAVFMWPAGQPLIEGFIGKLELEPVTALMFGAYVTGILGISLVGAILDVFQSRKSRMEAEND